MHQKRNNSITFVVCASVALGLSGLLVVKISRASRSPSTTTVLKLVDGEELVSENKFGTSPIILLGGTAYAKHENGTGVHKRSYTFNGIKFAEALPIENEYRIYFVEDAGTGMRDWLVIRVR